MSAALRVATRRSALARAQSATVGRGLAWPGREYVLGTNKRYEGIVARLPSGSWTVTRHDVMARLSTVLSRDATGRFRFDSPAARAVLFHFKRN